MGIDQTMVFSEEIDIKNCEKEPIHIIGKSQSHGVLIACNPVNLEITQCSENTFDLFGVVHHELLGNNLVSLIGQENATELQEKLKATDFSDPQKVDINNSSFLMLPHLSGANLVLDFEPLIEILDPFHFQKRLSRIMRRLKAADSVKKLCSETASLTKELFGYDRVMVYRFDEDWNGEVIAEEKRPEAESWLGLHYPASDIPAQARNMFYKHRVRIIADANYVPVPITPEISPLTKEPLDLSKSNLRAVSPIHIEYLQNMGVGASLTAAIIVNNKLWGLVACHHNTARFLNYYERESCSFLSQVLSNELALWETNNFLTKTEKSDEIRMSLISQMKETGFSAALAERNIKFTDLFNCGGGALVLGDEIKLVEKSPSEEELSYLLSNFLRYQPDVYISKELSAEFSEAKNYASVASGILSIRISQNNYIIWFRPEARETVSWGGNPEKKFTYNEEKKRISPRKSFEKWSQERKGIAENWEKSDLGAAQALGENLRYFILENQKNEIEALNKRLLKAHKELELFSYGLSHDLRAPIRGIEGFVDILKEDYANALDEDGQEILDMLAQMVLKTNTLIDDILSYFRLDTGKIKREEVSVNALVDEILALYNPALNFSKTKISIQENMPKMIGDRRMLFQAWYNLVGNALKYSAEKESPHIAIGYTKEQNGIVYHVQDNGIGIEAKHQDKIFEAFARVAGTKFSGTGIGLALVKRIVEKHDGKIWVESKPGQYSKFYFSLGDVKGVT